MHTGSARPVEEVVEGGSRLSRETNCESLGGVVAEDCEGVSKIGLISTPTAIAIGLRIGKGQGCWLSCHGPLPRSRQAYGCFCRLQRVSRNLFFFSCFLPAPVPSASVQAVPSVAHCVWGLELAGAEAAGAVGLKLTIGVHAVDYTLPRLYLQGIPRRDSQYGN